MYGHTLLRIDARDQDERTRLLAYAINFAADTDEKNGLVFAVKGLLGGYPGTFSVLPYYLKVREYGDLENRDLWEYELDLSPPEVDRVLRSGGVFVGSVPNAFRVQSRLRFLRGRAPEDDPTHLRMFSPGSLRELLAGFEPVELEFVGGRYRRLHPRLLARDLVFTARRR
jgi:hypothetical protein